MLARATLLAALLALRALGATLVSTPAALLRALATMADPEVRILAPILLPRTLRLGASHSGLALIGAHPSAALLLSASAPPSPVLAISGAANITVRALAISHSPATPRQYLLPAALALADSSGVALSGLRVVGGVRIAGGAGRNSLSRSDVSNPRGAQNGTCIYVPHCGDSPTLTPCGLAIQDNLVHDCRFDGRSPYVASAQGVLLGAQAGDARNGSLGCTVGVVVAHNNITGTDEMGARVATDYLCASAQNQVVFNKIENWGQLDKGRGGDTTDSGCLYLYGHWMSPGNNFSYNYCASRNASWGQNGLYMDDAATGATLVGNVFFNATGGVALKLNGGSHHTVANNLVIQGIGMGFAVCRGLRPPAAYVYTCENPNTGARWMGVLQANGYRAEPWASAFPWYEGWCNRTTAGPRGYPCAPPGAPPAYECPALPTGNAVSLFAGVGMRRNSSFAIPTAPGFPYLDSASPCARFVVDQAFNSIGESYFVEGLEENFVDPGAEDWTLRGGAPLFAAAPGFQPIPFRSLGIRG